MEEYRSLKAAITAAERRKDSVFRPWGLNTLAIFAAKGAPASPEVIRRAGAMVLVKNPHMQNTAKEALRRIASESSRKVRAFIKSQKKWVSAHDVYGTASSFK
jgi:hypothetical protein